MHFQVYSTTLTTGGLQLKWLLPLLHTISRITTVSPALSPAVSELTLVEHSWRMVAFEEDVHLKNRYILKSLKKTH